MPVFETTRPLGKVAPPPAYWIPAAWPEVIERLKLHGVVVEELSEPRKVDVEVYRLGEPQYGEEPYEGRLTVKAEASLERRRMLFPAGSVRVRVDQPLGTLAVLLLEPASSDSFFQWGFFLSIFQRTEYGESYVLEPLAEQMLADPAVEAAFSLRLKEDPAFAADPRQRLGVVLRAQPVLRRALACLPRGPRGRRGQIGSPVAWVLGSEQMTTFSERFVRVVRRRRPQGDLAAGGGPTQGPRGLSGPASFL